MLLSILTAHAKDQQGYIAGTDDGIVTVVSTPTSRAITVLNADTLHYVCTATSTLKGNYLIMGLDPNKRYLIMARDHKREYEPFAWDWVVPATDLTITEQWALWESWQNE